MGIGKGHRREVAAKLPATTITRHPPMSGLIRPASRATEHHTKVTAVHRLVLIPPTGSRVMEHRHLDSIRHTGTKGDTVHHRPTKEIIMVVPHLPGHIPAPVMESHHHPTREDTHPTDSSNGVAVTETHRILDKDATLHITIIGPLEVAL